MANYNKYTAACPDELELFRYKNGTLAEEDKDLLNEHLLICDRCPISLHLLPSDAAAATLSDESQLEAQDRAISDSLRDAVKKYQAQVAAETDITPLSLKDFLSTGQQLKAGQIWRTKLDGIIVPTDLEKTFSVTEMGSVPHLVVITNPSVDDLYFEGRMHRVIKVVPVTDDVERALEGDLVFDEKENPLGYPLMLEMWNQQHMLRDNLDSYLEALSVSPKSLAGTDESLVDLLIRRGEQTEYDEANDFSFFGLIKKGVYADPRMRFRAMEFENTAYLREPFLMLRESLNEAFEAAEIPTSVSRQSLGIEEILEGIESTLEQTLNLSIDRVFTSLASSIDYRSYARAGTSEIRLLVDLDEYLGGKVIMDIQPNRDARITGDFLEPESLPIYLVNVSQGNELVPMRLRDGEIVNRVESRSALDVVLGCEIDCIRRDSLVLIVLK
jgi:hypothetical protein